MGEEDFQDRLMPGERIVWIGQAGTGFLLTGRDIFLIPFSLLWTGMLIFIFAGANFAQARQSLAFQIMPLAFAAFGFYAVIGQFFVDIWLRSRTRYAITSRRVLILRSVPTTKFTALSIDRLPELSLDEKRDGSGTIRFGASPPFYGRGFSSWTPALDPTPQFLAIQDARNVFSQIQKLSMEKA